jgi:hypothetical protein
MSLTLRKWFFAWGEKKEQKFLEDMALKGYKLSSVGIGRYTFEEFPPCELMYQFDFKGLKQNDLDEYLQIYEDDGWELVARLSSWYYFCKKKEDGAEISAFNDNASQKEKYKRLLIFLAITGFPVYYQGLIFFPSLLATGHIETFYQFFLFILYPIMILHFYAVIRILLRFRKLSTEIKE